VRADRGFIWGRLRGRGARVLNRIGESRGDHTRNGIVLVMVSGEGMTCGALSSAAGGEGFGTDWGKEVSGSWAVSLSRPKCSRRPFFLFLKLFPFSFSVFL
jgi:hypothetical protein